MTLGEIYKFLDRLSPFASQEAWDNSGLILGRAEAEVGVAYLSLDLDLELIEAARPGALFITHHPLIFSPLKTLAGQAYPQALIQKMMAKDQALISLHTNFDKSHLNRHFTEAVLGLEVEEVDGFLIFARVDCSLGELAEMIKKSMRLPCLKLTPPWPDEMNARLGRVGICTGSGGELIPSVMGRAECFVSADLKYHQAFAARQQGLALIDVGHFESELYFGACLGPLLGKLPLKTIITNPKNPFHYH